MLSSRTARVVCYTEKPYLSWAGVEGSEKYIKILINLAIRRTIKIVVFSTVRQHFQGFLSLCHMHFSESWNTGVRLPFKNKDMVLNTTLYDTREER